MIISAEMQEKLKQCHLAGLKAVKIGEYLGVSKPKALEIMNVYLHGIYKTSC